MPDGPEYVSISLSLPGDYHKRLQRLAAQKGIDVTGLLREWIAADLVQWIPDEAKEIRRSPTFREIRFGAALRGLRRIQSGYRSDLPGLGRCIKYIQEAISKARAQTTLD